MTTETKPNIHVIIVAAGIGRRFAGQDPTTQSQPKQYQLIGTEPVLCHSIRAFDEIDVNGITVVLHPEDQYWDQVKMSQSNHPVATAVGGLQRHDSVRNGIKALSADHQDWVLVHDAARPCVSQHEIQKLIDTCTSQQQGGLLVKPVNDTIKFSAQGSLVDKTMNRDQLYAALTPQMFRCGDLLKALTVFEAGSITDESSALEAQGQHPLMVIGKHTNIKITAREDLAIATQILKLQGRLS